MLLNKLDKVSLIYRNTRFSWRLPRKKAVLIFDSSSHEEFYSYIEKSNTEVLDVVNKKINVLILILSIFSRNSYYEKYISFVNPKVLLTFIDNNLSFYKLKVKKSTIKISVQNGYRSALGGDIFSIFYGANFNQKKNLYSDFMLVFGPNIAGEISKYISCKTINIGSFRSNMIPIIRNKKQSRSVIFVSTFRDPYLAPNCKISEQITWKEYIKKELEFIEWLFSLTSSMDLKLSILGSSYSSPDSEFHFFKALSKGKGFEFYKRDDNRRTYEIVDMHEMTVAIDSTLGYESMARGNKVAFYGGIRGSKFPLNTRKFGWPDNNNNSGYFWTSSADIRDWNEVFQRVLGANIKDWEQECRGKIDEVILNDMGNSIFIDLLKKYEISVTNNINNHELK